MVLIKSKRFPNFEIKEYTELVTEKAGEIVDELFDEFGDEVPLSVAEKFKDEDGRSRIRFLEGPLVKYADFVKSVDFTKR